MTGVATSARSAKIDSAGDGSTAKSLPDKPKNFTDIKFMRAEEPQEFYKNITNGKESMPFV